MAKAILRKTRETRVRGGHPWIYASEIETTEGECAPGDVIDVHSCKGTFLGRALYNPRSQITLRMLTTQDEAVDEDFFRRRLEVAWAYRKRLCDVDSCRVVYSESDFLPGLIVDKFADVLSMQTLSLGMDMRKEMLARLLCEITGAKGVYERNDVPVRRHEGLEMRTGLLMGEVPERVEMRENGILYLVDVMHGQKTGFFLDQKQNRAAIAPLCPGARVLDCFCHNGSFALNAARYGAADVLGVDISEDALEVARENAARNGVADRFKVLVGDLSDKASGQYNIITANIVAAAILSLAPHVPVLMAPGARFIASGIIDERKDEVLAGLKAAGLEPVEVKEKRGWVCIICEKKEA